MYVVLLIGLISCMLGIISYYDTARYSYGNNHPEEVTAYNAWLDCLSIGSSVYRLILPLLITPFIDSYFMERKMGYQNFILARCNRRKYFFTKWFSGSLTAAGIVALILVLTLIICISIFPLNQPIPERTYLHKNFGINYYLNNPFKFIVLLILSNMFVAVVYYTIGFSFSNSVKNQNLLKLIPFLLFLCQLYLSQALNIPAMSPLVFIAYYEVIGLTPKTMVYTGVCNLFIAFALLLICYWKDKHNIGTVM